MIKEKDEISGLTIIYDDEEIAQMYGGYGKEQTDIEKCLYAGCEETRSFGANNKLPHQQVITNILMLIKQYLANEKMKGVNVLSELNISKLNACESPKLKGFKKDYNIDVLTYRTIGRQTVICAIEVLGENLDYVTGKKLEDLLRNMPGAEVIVVILYKERQRYKVKIQKYVLDSNGDLDEVKSEDSGVIKGLGLDLNKHKII